MAVSSSSWSWNRGHGLVPAYARSCGFPGAGCRRDAVVGSGGVGGPGGPRGRWWRPGRACGDRGFGGVGAPVEECTLRGRARIRTARRCGFAGPCHLPNCAICVAARGTTRSNLPVLAGVLVEPRNSLASTLPYLAAIGAHPPDPRRVAPATVRVAGSITPQGVVRDCRRACCALARTPAVEGLTVHITPGRAGNSRGAGSTLVVAVSYTHLRAHETRHDL